MLPRKLAWQSKLVLLLVLPFAGAGLVLQAHWWANLLPSAAIWTCGISLLLALIVLKLRAANLAGASTGALLTASLMFSTTEYPYAPWHTALPSVLAVSLLASVSTRLGRERKAQLGTAEARHGRNAAQIAANLGFAALMADAIVRIQISDRLGITAAAMHPQLILAPALAALAEAAADTVSSEIGQVLGGRPRLITSFRPAEPGTDGAISLAGTLAGIAAACIVAAIGALSLGGDASPFWIVLAGAVFGLLFDSLLGATLERRGWLNNDAVNFLSTISAAAFALALLATLPHLRAQ
jgi:uncharacterized protein (TIGR00297 family)